MKKIAIGIMVSLFCILAFAQEALQGYVLKAGEGEETCCGLIKASPRTGSQSAVMILQPMPSNFSTGIHYHEEADEFFYVVSGSGSATVAGIDHEISTGDVIFVPAGEDHRLMTQSSDMVILEFLDKPGLDDEFRSEFSENVTLEELNRIANPLGTVYKTLE